MSVTMVVLGLLFRKEDDAGEAEGSSAVGLGGVMVGLGIALGPGIGGFVAEHLNWRWVFYINLPLGVAAILVSIWLVNFDVPTVRRRVDYFGAALIAAAASTLLLVSQWGGSEYAWNSDVILGLIGGGMALLAVFVWWQLTTPEPILNLRLIFNRTFRVLIPLGFISGIGLSGSVAYISGYLQVGRGLTPTTGGLLLLPMAAGMTLAGLLSTKVAGRLGKFQLLLGYVLIALAMVMFSRLGVHTPQLYVGIPLFILGIGLGQCLGVGLMIAQDSVGVDELGQATTSIRFVQQLGASFGLALFGTVLNRTLAHELAATTGGALGGSSGLNLGSLATLPAPLQHAAVAAFVYSTHQVFLIASVIMVVPVILLLFLRTSANRPPAAASPVAEPDVTRI
jgi:predicted MFS family arabinose efflux permease